MFELHLSRNFLQRNNQTHEENALGQCLMDFHVHAPLDRRDLSLSLKLFWAATVEFILDD